MKFFILIAFIGSYNGGPAMLRFESEVECRAAERALKEEVAYAFRYIECIPVVGEKE